MAAPRQSTFLRLPGFFPDAIPYALRTTLALLLAYGIGFYTQLSTASSAGVTVGIIAQPSAGMALSKAFYRVGGTCIGCAVAIVLGAAFGQDRTMLLLAFAIWMGLCSAAASLLRDFRSYGAAISGYTVAIIAIGGIDDPDGLVLSSLNRTAAICLGIAAVAVVNTLFGGVTALDGLVQSLKQHRAETAAMVADALDGRPVPGELDLTRRAAAIVALQSAATYAAAERPDGRRRRRGAQVAIGALLTTISVSRTVAGVLDDRTPAPVRAWLGAIAAHLRGGPAPDTPPPPVQHPSDALLLERAESARQRFGSIDAGIAVLEGGTAAPLPPVVLRPTHDIPGAIISGIRTTVAFGLAATFIVLAGWPGATLVLVQQASFVGLLGAQPTPVKASIGFLLPLLPTALLVGLVVFLLMPVASGFAMFALAAGGTMFLGALLGRARRIAPFSGALLIYVTLLLQPENPQQFDLAGFVNTTLELALAVVFTILAFVLVLPVSPTRRLYRAAIQIIEGTRGTARGHPEAHAPEVAQALLYDRLVRALTFLGHPTPARQRMLDHLYRTGAAGIALIRARTALAALRQDRPDAAPLLDAAGQALDARDVPAALAAARALLAGAGPQTPTLRRAVSGIADVAFQEGDRKRVSRFIRLMTG